MKTNSNATEIVLSYSKALDKGEYDAAGKYINDSVTIKGPAGETFGKPGEFIKMLRQYRGRYELKKTFADGDDVCLLYDLVTPAAKVFMCSWLNLPIEKKLILSGDASSESVHVFMVSCIRR